MLCSIESNVMCSFRVSKSAVPAASIKTVLACMRVLPEMAIGPTVRFIFWSWGWSSACLHRSNLAVRMAAGLQ